MSYSIIKKHNIKPRSSELNWNQNGPGLYQHSKQGAPAPETVVKLNTGETVALSVETEFRSNDLAVHLCGWARLIEEDGSSVLSPDGVPIETSCSVGIANADIVAKGLSVYKAEVLKLLLGEKPTMIDKDTRLMWVGDEQMITANIRNAIASLASLHDGGDVTKLL